jgi:hypothetical protein
MIALPRPTLFQNALPLRLALAAALLALGVLTAVPLPVAPGRPSPALDEGQMPAAVPLMVVPTRSEKTPYASFGPAGALAFGAAGVSLALPDGQVLVVEFAGAQAARLAPQERQPSVFNAFVGADPAGWQRGLPTYAALHYEGLYPGIDLRYDGQNGRLKGTYRVAAGADPSVIGWRYAGAEQVALDAGSGDLVVTLPGGQTMVEEAPIAWQEVDGQRLPVAVRFTLEGGLARFALGAYDVSQPLVIDPALIYATYLGGRSSDIARGLALDAAGHLYVVGDFYSNNFMGYETVTAGSKDAIILKFDPAGTTLLYGTFLGSTSADDGLALAVNAAGEVFAAIDPGANDFPLLNAAIGTLPEAGDGILIKLNAAGDLVFSTYLGFGLATPHTRQAVTVDANGFVYVTGQTYVPTNRRAEVALVKLRPDTGARLMGHLLAEQRPVSAGSAVVVGDDGQIYVTGYTESWWNEDFPTTPGALQSVCGRQKARGPFNNCDSDGFLMILDQTGAVTYATYLGGDGSDDVRGLALDSAGNVWLAGNTFAADFPTTPGALQSECFVNEVTESCPYSGFVTKLAPDGRSILFSTFLDSANEAGQTFVTGLALDTNDNAYVLAFTNGDDHPVPGAVQPQRNTFLCLGVSMRFCFDALLLRFAPDGTLTFGTYLGGQLDEHTAGVAVDQNGNVVLAGDTESLDFPATSGAPQTAKQGMDDFFLARISLVGGGGGGGGGGGSSGSHRLYLPALLWGQ